jgi:hypothetical protein
VADRSRTRLRAFAVELLNRTLRFPGLRLPL